MDIAQRALMVKANLYDEFGTARAFDRASLKQAICNSGLSPKSSSIQKVVNYMRNNKHIKQPEHDVYQIMYRRKDRAHPKGIPNLTGNNGADITCKISRQPLWLDKAIEVTVHENIRAIEKIVHNKKECVIKLQWV